MTDETKPVGTAGIAIAVPPEAAFWQALANPTVPKIYANTFGVVIHPTDLAITFGQAGVITGIVALNYIIAKTLATKLQEAIAAYERNTGVEVLNAEVLEKRIREKPVQS
jgi:hypothetical protein